MLVLTRKPGEEIVIGDNVRVTVVSVGPGRVKIGVVAPPDVKVDRSEVHVKKQAEEVAAPVVLDGTPAGPLHNRIADKLPAAEPAEAAAVPPVESRLKQVRRLPRKSR